MDRRGAGAIVQAPTTSDSAPGSCRRGLGPTFVVLRLEAGDPWVCAVLVDDVRSMGGGAGGSCDAILMQCFANDDFADRTYLTTSPVVSANWKAGSGDRWTMPPGGGGRNVFHLGRLPVNAQVGGLCDAVRPDDAANPQIRAQARLTFPK